jgi:hypothetical protein
MSGTTYAGFCRRFQPGRASSFIRHAADDLKRGDAVVLCCRVSRCLQKRRGNVADQEANLRNVAARYGANVVGVVQHVGSGVDACWLARAVALAAAHGGAKLLAETTPRFVRPPQYDRDCQDAQAREMDLMFLRYCTEGNTLVSDLHPDAMPAAVRAYERRRGQHAKGNRGGRPKRLKRRRAELRPRALEMRRQGLSLGQIAAALEVPRATVQRWVR